MTLVTGIGVAGTNAATTVGPNFCYSKEQWQLYYDGYVQVKASYSDSGRNAKSGWLRYTIADVADSGRQSTPNTTSRTSTAVKSESYRFWDSPDWNAPATQFSCGYKWW